MFIEFQTKDDKRISYNVEKIVFVGEMNEDVSVMFIDGTHVIFPDEYVSTVKNLIKLSREIPVSCVFAQFKTKKEERIAFPLGRVFFILEETNDTTIIMFDDGTRIIVIDDYEIVINRIKDKLKLVENCPLPPAESTN